MKYICENDCQTFFMSLKLILDNYLSAVQIELNFSIPLFFFLILIYC